MSSIIIALTFVTYAYLFTFTPQSNIIYNDLITLSNIKITNAMLSAQSDILYMLATAEQTKIVAVDFATPSSIICSTFTINGNVLSVLDNEFVISDNYSVIRLNNTQVMLNPINKTFHEILRTVYSGMYLSIGDTIQPFIFNRDSGLNFIGGFKMPTNMLSYSFSLIEPLLYYTSMTSTAQQFSVMDYSTQKILFDYTLINSTVDWYRKIFVSSDSKYVILHFYTNTTIFLCSYGSCTRINVLQYNITHIEEITPSVFMAKIANTDSIAILDTSNEFEVDPIFHFKIGLEYQFKIKNNILILMSAKGLYIYSFVVNDYKTFFAMNISFIIPLGSVILVMGITILVVCLRIKRKIPLALVQPAFPQPNPILRLRSDETVVTEENKRMSYGKLLVNLRKLIECSFTKDLMKEPVVISDGYTYEKQFIEKFLVTNDKSPITKAALDNKTVIANKPLKEFIEEWCKEEKQM